MLSPVFMLKGRQTLFIGENEKKIQEERIKKQTNKQEKRKRKGREWGKQRKHGIKSRQWKWKEGNETSRYVNLGSCLCKISNELTNRIRNLMCKPEARRYEDT